MSDPLDRMLVAALVPRLLGTSTKLFSLVQSGVIPEGIDGGDLVEQLDELGYIAQCSECEMWLGVGEVVDGRCEDCIWEAS